MRDSLTFIAITILFLVIKSTLLPFAPLPDLPLIIVFYCAYTRPSVEGVVLSFALGYMDDYLSGGHIGVSSFALVTVYALTYILSKKVHLLTPLSKAIGAAFMSLVKVIVMYGVLVFAGSPPALTGGVTASVLITGLFAPAVTTLFTRFRIPSNTKLRRRILP